MKEITKLNINTKEDALRLSGFYQVELDIIKDMDDKEKDKIPIENTWAKLQYRGF